MSKRRNKQKDSVKLNITVPWKVSKGHQDYRGSSGIMSDRRVKRSKTRQAQRKAWENE